MSSATSEFQVFQAQDPCPNAAPLSPARRGDGAQAGRRSGLYLQFTDTELGLRVHTALGCPAELKGELRTGLQVPQDPSVTHTGCAGP